MAFIRKQGQGVQMNEPAYPVSGGMLGSGEATGKKQSTDAGQPGGWTNIQDYLTANKSDQTNLNMAKQKSQEKIQQGASNIATQTQNLTALPTANTYDRSKINEALASDQYDILSKGLSQQEARNQLSALPTVEQEIAGYAPIEQGVANVNPQDFQSSMEFIGSLAPQSPNYSAGQQSFDTMLLQGSPEFRTSFVPTMKEQYKTSYEEPLKQAREARTTARTNALAPIEQAGQDWRSGIQGYLGEETGKIQTAAQKQQQHYTNMQNDANMDINQRIAAFTQSTGQAPSNEMITLWNKAKTDATRWLQNAQAPTQETAVNEYLAQPGDQTKMQDLIALYNTLGITPEYSQPTTGTRYNYDAFI